MKANSPDRDILSHVLPRPKVTFGKYKPGSFHKDVKDRVDNYFTSNKISKSANSQMVFKTVLILLGWVGTYLLIILNLVSPPVMLILALFHGFLTAMIGMNIAHDAIHGAYSKNSWLNKRIGVLFNLLGANDYVWGITHNIVHHTYTNIPLHDEDIHQVPILRMEPTQKLWRIHRFQYIYAYLVYCFATVSWVFAKDYVKFFQKQLGGHYRKTFPRKEIFRLFIYKSFYYITFIVVPLILVDLPWYWIMFGFFAAHFVEGFTLAVIFSLAHVVEETDYPIPGPDNKMELQWADLQMHTTANFGEKNRLVNYLCGGLNFQIIHHLFPKVCHVHYPKIAGIVKETAKDHNLPYIEYDSFFGAVASHTRLLKRFGREPAVSRVRVAVEPVSVSG